MVSMSGEEQTACRRPNGEPPGLKLLSASRSFVAVKGSMYRSDTLRPKNVGTSRPSSDRIIPSFMRKSSTFSAASSKPSMVV